MNGPAPSSAAPRTLLIWAAAIAAATAAVLAAAEWHGRASRVPFPAPAALARRPLATVGSAADAFLLWRGSGSNGRRLVVLTGQWSSRPGGKVDAHSALYWAARLGVVRAVDVVMPAAPFAQRVAAVEAHKDFRREDGAFRLDLHGFWFRFSLPGAFRTPAEPALVLVEPSWFSGGAPPDPLAWLAAAGLRTDLALVALDDPSASDGDRLAAAAYAKATGLPRLEVTSE